MSFEHHYLQAEGCRIHYVQAGPQQPDPALPTLVFLHGFPECWLSWQAQLKALSEDYRVVAPDLPGYNLSEKPADTNFYQVTNLVNVMAGFIQALCDGKPVVLIAHDWGGALAWPLTAFYPHLVQKLVIVNAAHPSTFTREMINNPEQRRKSAYIHKLVAEDGVAWASADNYARLRRMLFEGRRDQGFSEDEKAAYFEAWSQPAALASMLQYYHHMPQLAAETADQEELAAYKIPQIRIDVPTLVMWGLQDEAFTNKVLDGLDRYVKNLKLVPFADASHWLQHEKADEVSRRIDEFVRQR